MRFFIRNSSFLYFSLRDPFYVAIDDAIVTEYSFLIKMNDKEREFSALKLSLEFGYTIVIPLVAFALLGRMLDRWLDTSPWLLIGGIILSMVASSVGLVIKFRKIVDQINEKTESDKKKDEKKQ